MCFPLEDIRGLTAYLLQLIISLKIVSTVIIPEDIRCPKTYLIQLIIGLKIDITVFLPEDIRGY